MKMQLERLFIEGEQERIKQENIEKQQAEQIAAGMCDDLYHTISLPPLSLSLSLSLSHACL